MLSKILGEVKGIFNIVTWAEMIEALVYVIIGIIFFVNPKLSFNVVATITGIALIVNGLISIFSYFKRADIDLYNYNLIFGLILVGVGIATIFMDYLVAITLGIYLIVSGLQKASYGLLLKKFNESSWLTILIIGVLFIVLGAITIFTSPDAVVKVAGICLLGYGLINFVDTLLLRRRAKYFLS